MIAASGPLLGQARRALRQHARHYESGGWPWWATEPLSNEELEVIAVPGGLLRGWCTSAPSPPHPLTAPDDRRAAHLSAIRGPDADQRSPGRRNDHNHQGHQAEN